MQQLLVLLVTVCLSVSYSGYSPMMDVITGENPLEGKIIAGFYLLSTSTLGIVASPVVIAGIADGLVDIVKGTHHYVVAQIERALTTNPEEKARIEADMEYQLKRIEEPITLREIKDKVSQLTEPFRA